MNSRPPIGVRIAGTGRALPEGRVTNTDLEKVMDTTSEWVVQRTGINERRKIDRANGQSNLSLSAESLNKALAQARLEATDLDLILLATMTQEMMCPPGACRLAAEVKAGDAGAMDITAACCGFVYGLNLAETLIRSGSYNTIALVGTDTLTDHMLYTDEGRSTAILFGDGSGAAILKATDDTSKGIIAQSMHADGGRWADLYLPRTFDDFPDSDDPSKTKLNHVQMNGRAVFKFAVGTFSGLIAETLEKAGLVADDVDHYVCHQSNARILQAARDRFGLPEDKLYINIQDYGNTVAASVPICLDELIEAGRVTEGQKVMFVAFGGGLTWGSSLWQF